jgi:hypothetical protein
VHYINNICSKFEYSSSSRSLHAHTSHLPKAEVMKYCSRAQAMQGVQGWHEYTELLVEATLNPYPVLRSLSNKVCLHILFTP